MWLIRGLWCTIMSCKWGTFMEFYRLSGIYFHQYYSSRLCVCGRFFSDGGRNFPLWLLSLLLFSWITGQAWDKLWPKCQFQFHLHCIFLNWLLRCYIYDLQTYQSRKLSIFSCTSFLDCVLLIKTAWKECHFLLWLDEMNQNIPEDNTLTPSKGNNLIFSELIRLRKVTHSDVWLSHGCALKKPRLLVKQQTFFISEGVIKNACTI